MTVECTDSHSVTHGSLQGKKESFQEKMRRQVKEIQDARWCWVHDMVVAFEEFGLDVGEVAKVFGKTREELIAEFTLGAEYEWMRRNHSAEDFSHRLYASRN